VDSANSAALLRLNTALRRGQWAQMSGRIARPSGMKSHKFRIERRGQDFLTGNGGNDTCQFRTDEAGGGAIADFAGNGAGDGQGRRGATR
jgi:hypothetical protein